MNQETKTISIKILKKNRVWIEALNKQGYKIKIRNDNISKELTENEYIDVLVKDISIRSKYGVDIRYEIIKENSKSIFLDHFAYNQILVEKCRDLGGVWDDQNSCWVFDEIVEDKVTDLEELFNTDIVNVEIRALNDTYGYCDSVEFCGYTIAFASGRDSGAKLSKNVSMISGEIDSGGSVKNWSTIIHKDSIFRLRLSKNLLEKYTPTQWQITIL